jgi:hypothetical protein
MVKPRIPQMPKQPKPVAPAAAVTKPPRLKPISTRVYGKGGTPVSSAPDMGLRGAGIGYGGPEDGA